VRQFRATTPRRSSGSRPRRHRRFPDPGNGGRIGALAYSRTRIGGVQYLPLLRPAGDGRWTELTVAWSMRETEHDLNLLLPAAPAIFDPVYDTPEWRWAVASAADNETNETPLEGRAQPAKEGSP
jgi:hypothetical protein